MSFFDSPKNRAIWDRELRVLRAERERRAREGYKPQETSGKENSESPFRKRISLSELEAKLTPSQEKNSSRRREWAPARKAQREAVRQEEKASKTLKGREL